MIPFLFPALLLAGAWWHHRQREADRKRHGRARGLGDLERRVAAYQREQGRAPEAAGWFV